MAATRGLASGAEGPAAGSGSSMSRGSAGMEGIRASSSAFDFFPSVNSGSPALRARSL